MTDAYVDACCIIYLVEGTAAWRTAVEARLRTLPSATGLVTSRVSRLECRSKPMRDGDAALLGRYDATFAKLRVLDVTAAVIERATELRARYRFRSPDALHLATALESGVDVFLTGDAELARCTEITVALLTTASAAP